MLQSMSRAITSGIQRNCDSGEIMYEETWMNKISEAQQKQAADIQGLAKQMEDMNHRMSKAEENTANLARILANLSTKLDLISDLTVKVDALIQSNDHFAPLIAQMMKGKEERNIETPQSVESEEQKLSYGLISQDESVPENMQLQVLEVENMDPIESDEDDFDSSEYSMNDGTSMTDIDMVDSGHILENYPNAKKMQEEEMAPELQMDVTKGTSFNANSTPYSETNSFPCLIKMYDVAESELKLNDIFEFVGVFTFDPELTAVRDNNGMKRMNLLARAAESSFGLGKNESSSRGVSASKDTIWDPGIDTGIAY